MLSISSSPEGDIQDPSRFIVSSTAHVEQPHLIDTHQHARGQLLLSDSNSLTVSIEDTCWNLSPKNAIWIQPNHFHSVQANTSIHYYSVYVDFHVAETIKLSSGLVTLTPLLKTLIQESSTFGNKFLKNSPESRLNQLLLDTMTQMDHELCPVIMPRNLRVSKLCEDILQNPSVTISLQELANQSYFSVRNVARIFKDQTRMSFIEWRNRVMVSYAIEKLKKGESVTHIGIDLGYTTTSSFTTMFKKTTGKTSSQYMKENHF